LGRSAAETDIDVVHADKMRARARGGFAVSSLFSCFSLDAHVVGTVS
jgi:hypothetical protein